MAILLAGAAAGIGVFLLASCALAALAPLIISVLLFGLAYSGLTLSRRQGGKPTFGSKSVWLALMDLPVFLLTRSLNLSPVLLGSVCLGLGLLTSGLAGWLISVGTAGRGGD